jgi:creatinine amidohydrolase
MRTPLLALWLVVQGTGVWAGTVFMEDMSTTELRAHVASGHTTVLIPIGGTEQNGPHMALGKHNTRAKYLAGQIATRLGNAVVAPVLAYVPEGNINPPAAHMRFTGTLSIPEATFESILESTAQSLKQHGFRDIVFLGDHGGYQKNMVRAAAKVNKAWAGDTRYRAYGLSAYYQAGQAPFIQVLKNKGYTDAEIGTHAGLLDTALTLAVDPASVRTDLLAQAAQSGAAQGVYGDPRRASTELGRVGVEIIVEKTVQAIKEAVLQRVSR